MSEDFSEFGAFAAESHEEVRVGPEDGVYPDISALKAVLTSASALAETEEPDEGDFGPDGDYKGFPILAQRPKGVPSTHSTLELRFYVSSPLGAVGLVPWPGSKIIWPWERGWVQDLHRETVTSFLKPQEEKKAKK